MIPIYQPFLPKKTLVYAHEALNSSWISNIGKYKELSKKALQDILKNNFTILTNNGTASTHLLYKALKIKKPNIKNIIVPINVYVAAWNSLLFDGDNINLIPIRCDLNTWNANVQDIIEEAKTRNPNDTAILIVHNLGNIINVPKLKRELPDYEIIEDNCEGFLGKYEGAYSGTKSLASSISFYGNKTITCGEGGATVLNDQTIAEKIEKVHSQGQTETRYIHDVIGYNYRMTNVQSAILYGQLINSDEIIKRKNKIFERYKKRLKNCKKIVFRYQEENCENALWMFAIRIIGNKSYENAKDFFLAKKIEIRNMFYPMSYHEHLSKYSDKSKELEAEILLKEIIIFPSSPNLSLKDVDYISSSILEYCELNEQK